MAARIVCGREYACQLVRFYGFWPAYICPITIISRLYAHLIERAENLWSCASRLFFSGCAIWLGKSECRIHFCSV